jgi:hypothetical protein
METTSINYPPYLLIIVFSLFTFTLVWFIYWIRLLFQRQDTTKFEFAYNCLKGEVLFGKITKDNFAKIELSFKEIKCLEMQQSRITELYNYFMGRFDKVNKYKGKKIQTKPDRDIFKIRLESNIETFIKELSDIIKLEEEALEKGNRKELLLYRDNERITTEKLELLRNILNVKQ